MRTAGFVRHLLATVIVVLAGACNNPVATSANDEAAIAASPAGARADANVADEFTAPADSVPVVTSQPSAAVPAKLALDGEGLRVFATGSGSSRLLAFGTMREEAMGMLESVQGTPASDQGENIDCGASYARWPDGLTVWFADGEFAGWSVGSANATVATASSLRVGSTREELEAAYAVRVAPSTLGTEFSAGGIGGLLGSPGEGAQVTDLWAGRTCIAR